MLRRFEMGKFENYRDKFLNKIFSTEVSGDVEVIEYTDNNHIVVKFLNTGNARHTSCAKLKLGTLLDVEAGHKTKARKHPIPKEGDIGTIRKGAEFIITKYVNNTHVEVRFTKSGYTTVTTSADVRSGSIKDPWFPVVFNRGYFGKGEYDRSNSKEAYDRWYNMMLRCYSDKPRHNSLAYEKAEVCEEWYNFQNFAEWFYSQPNHDKPDYGLDKDLLIRDNKTYCPDACCFLPTRLNSLLIKNKTKRNAYPIGVRWDRTKRKFSTEVSYNGKNYHLGYYNSVDVAFNVYKEEKERLIKKTVLEYKDCISESIFDLIYNHEILITD
jgi:hypothetical protein